MSSRPLKTWRRKTHVTLGQPFKKLLRGVTKTPRRRALSLDYLRTTHKSRSPRHNSGRLTAYGPALPVLCSTSATSPSSHSVSLCLSASQPNGTHRLPVPVRLNGLLYHNAPPVAPTLGNSRELPSCWVRPHALLPSPPPWCVHQCAPGRPQARTLNCPRFLGPP